MPTKELVRSQVKNLTLENLESRLNLSRFGVNPFIPQPHATALTTPVVRGTYSALKPISPALTAATATSALPTFGDTSIPSSGASNIPVTSYSVMNGAQIEYVNGNPDVGYMSTSGADIEYKVNAAAAGTYQLNFSVAALSSASFDLAVNGSTQAQYAFSPTYAWQTYTTVSQTVTLAAGSNTLKISPTWGSQFNINGISLAPVNTPATPTTTVGSSATVPVANYSAIYNSQLESQNGTPDIGYVSTSGAYVEYTLNVQTAGNYNVNVGTAALTSASMNLSVNGTQAANYAISPTGSWGTFSANSANVYLPAGTVTLRFSSQNGTQYNIGSINISEATASKPITSIGSSTATVAVSSYSAIYNSQLESQNGTPDIGYVSTSGAYVEYTLNVQTAGTYTMNVATAAVSSAAFNVSVNGTQAATYSVNSTGSWGNFGTTAGSVYLPAGTVTLRFSSLNGTQYNIGGISISPAASAPTQPASPPPTSSSGNDVTVSTQWMTSFNQLNIVAGSKNDSILVTQSGNTITVNVNGNVSSYTGPFGDLVVKAGSGNDSITIDSSVSVDTLLYGGAGTDTLQNFTQGNATIVSIGDGYATVQGNGKNTAYWVDSGDSVNASSTEANAGDVHRVSGFWGGVSTSLQGQNLQDPSGTGSTTRLSNASLWGTGPTMQDINQGQSSDCYLLGAFQTLANSEPQALRQMAVDLGDGTYAVQFKRGGTTTYVRVDGDLPAGGPYANGLEYAHPGASGDIWMPIIEKAYAEFRTGAWSYSSLDEGNFGTVFSDMGIAYNSLSSGSASALYNSIVSALNNGKGVTVGTNYSIVGNAPLIYDHTYTVTAAWTDASGTQYIQVRNPWGFDGAANDTGDAGGGLINLPVSELAQNFMYGTALA